MLTRPFPSTETSSAHPNFAHQPAFNPHPPTTPAAPKASPRQCCLRPPSQWPPLRPSSASPPAAASPRPSSMPAPSSGPRPSPALPSCRPSPPTSAPPPSCAPVSTPRRPSRSSPPGTNDATTQWLARNCRCRRRCRLDCVGPGYVGRAFFPPSERQTPRRPARIEPPDDPRPRCTCIHIN
jgi:hypothetical protein